MDAGLLRIIIAAALLLHGIAHAIALFGVVAQTLSGPSEGKVTIRSWLLPALKPRVAALFALLFWTISTICFLAAAAIFWGILSGGPGWRLAAEAGAIISLLGIALFPSTWPGSQTPRRSLLDTGIAAGFDLIILVVLYWFHWPPLGLFGR